MSDRRRQGFLLGRYCAKIALCRHANVDDPRSLWLVRGVFDFPLVRGAEPAHAAVSISHSAGWGAAIAFDERHPLGVDIQDLGPDSIDTARSQLTEREKELPLLGTAADQVGPVLVWAMKEALSKVLRTGLMTPLEVYEIETLSHEGERWTATFTNFAQYQAVAFLLPGSVLAFALPKRSQVEIPDLPVSG